MKILSIIIPVYNEFKIIEKLLAELLSNINLNITEIIVVDGGSTDSTKALLLKYNSVQFIPSNFQNRAKQINVGANKAKGKILYFLHADSIPPNNFVALILKHCKKNNFGCFRTKYKSNNPVMLVNGWFTMFPFEFCRGGDQSMFIYKSTFYNIGAFDESYEIMEEYEFIRRAKKENIKFKILTQAITVSCRKYQNRSWLKVNRANLKAMKMFKQGKNSKYIKDTYLKMLG